MDFIVIADRLCLMLVLVKPFWNLTLDNFLLFTACKCG